MVNGLFTFQFRTNDLGFERGDACIEFDDRQRVEILADQRRKWIAGSRRCIVQIHERQR